MSILNYCNNKKCEYYRENVHERPYICDTCTENGCVRRLLSLYSNNYISQEDYKKKSPTIEEKFEQLKKEVKEKADKFEWKIPEKLTDEDIARINKDIKEYEEKIRESEKSVYRSMRLK